MEKAWDEISDFLWWQTVCGTNITLQHNIPKYYQTWNSNSVNHIVLFRLVAPNLSKPEPIRGEYYFQNTAIWLVYGHLRPLIVEK